MNYVLRAITYLWISNEIDNNIFKARVYGNLLRLLSKINKLGLKEIDEISKHKNIGKKSIEKLMEYYKTGKITVFENLTKNQISKIRKYLHAYKLLGFGKKEALEYSRNKNKE